MCRDQRQDDIEREEPEPRLHLGLRQALPAAVGKKGDQDRHHEEHVLQEARRHPEERYAVQEAQEQRRVADGQQQAAAVADDEDEENNVPDYYSIEVEVRSTRIDENGYEKEAWPVIFRRHFRIDELPMDFEMKPIDEVVSFDGGRNITKFDMGEKIYEYQLPPP